MGMYALTVDSARVRAGSWRGSDDLAYLVPLTSAATLTPSTLERIRARLRDDGFQSVVTAAVGPSERDMLAADGFTEHEALHLLRHDLREPLPSRPGRTRGLRRGHRRDIDAILDVDHQTFETFWRLDRDGLHEAINATPTARLRVIRDPDVVGYAVTGRAGTQGYLQRLAVHPDRQGEGRGIDLVADALHWLRRRDVDTCWVNTQEANAAALALYTKLGFVPAAHRLTVLRRDL
ncbi:MAG: GNAT family N-acetyltransferase [Actinomycetota bacterium]